MKDREKRKKLVVEAIHFVGLEDYIKMRPKKLSGGLLRRLNIACGIAHKPRLIIMDEPTVAVDPQSRNRILEGIQELNRQGSTIIYTSHYMEEVEQIDVYKRQDYMLADFKAKEGVDLSGDKMALQRLKEAAEKAKKELSSATTTNINLPFITATSEGPKHFDMNLTRAKFDELTHDLVAVSYTHLDVYKRQGQTRPMVAVSAPGIPPA